MKKIVCFLISFILPILASAQGLRHSVCVVYPEHTDADSAVLASFASEYARAGLRSEAQLLTAYSSGTFGSGVVISDGGRLCVLTNRHVIGYATTARLVFMLHDHTLTYSHCPVLSASRTADVAAVLLPPEAAAECVPLTFIEVPLHESDEIAAAGFPALANKASWQLTKGVVSNSRLTVEGSRHTFVQHTAPVDPGSSGGPLLLKRDGRWLLAGLNTLKAFYRDRVGLAVPVSELSSFASSLAVPDTTDRHVLAAMSKRGAAHWHEYYAAITSRERDSIGAMQHILPLDIAAAVYDAYDAAHPNDGTTGARSALHGDTFGLEDRLDESFAMLVGYDCFFLGNHNVSVIFAITGGSYFYQDVRLNVPLYRAGDGTDRVVGAMLGYNLGVQLPLRLNRDNRLVPIATIGVQAGGGKVVTGTSGGWGILIQPALRLGADYRRTIGNNALVVGAGYTLAPLTSSLDICAPPVGKSSLRLMLMHALTLRLGIAF